MGTVNVQSPIGDLARTVELPDEVFDTPLNVPLIHQVVVAQLAAARQGTHDTRTRGEVSGGGKKPYRQKGTGRARQGSIRAPQFTGGGTVHGPTPRSYEQRTPKKMKAAALRGALSDRARHGRVHVVTGLVEETISTKTAVANLRRITGRRAVLVVAERADELTWKSLRNVPEVHLIAPDQLNTYDVLVSDDVVFTEGGLDRFLGRHSDALAAPQVRPAGEGVSDTELVSQVREQTDPNLRVEPVYEVGAATQGAAAPEAAAPEAAAPGGDSGGADNRGAENRGADQ